MKALDQFQAQFQASKSFLELVNVVADIGLISHDAWFKIVTEHGEKPLHKRYRIRL